MNFKRVKKCKNKKKTTLTESQVKLKKLLTPIVEGILSEFGDREISDAQFQDFLDVFDREFKNSVQTINTSIRQAKVGKQNPISNVLKQYMVKAGRPNYDDAILAIIEYQHGAYDFKANRK